MNTLNELVRNKEWTKVIDALLLAYSMNNQDYLLSALDVIHEESTFWAGELENDEEALRRIPYLHALYCISLGLLKSLKGSEVSAPLEHIEGFVEDRDLSGLTEALIDVAMLRASGREVNLEILRKIRAQDPLLGSIIGAFVSLMDYLEQARLRGRS